MSTLDDQVLRVKRTPPERGGPIRSVSMAFRAPEQDNGQQAGQNFIAGAVNSAYRVIDDYLKQGEEAARMRQQQSMYESAGHHSSHPNPQDPPHHSPHPYPHPRGAMGPDISAIAWQAWSKMAQSWVDWAMHTVGQGMQMPWMSPWGGNGQQYGSGPTPPWGGFPSMNAPWMAMQWWWSIMSWWMQIMRMPYALGPQPPPWDGHGGPPGYPHHYGPHYQGHFGPQQQPAAPPFWPTNHNHPPVQNHQDARPAPQAVPHGPQSGFTGHAPPIDSTQNENPLGNIRPSANPTRPMAARIDPIIRIMAALPTDVHVDLPDPFIAMRTYAVSKVEANDPQANLPANAIAFHHEDGALVIAVTIHAHQHAAKYTARIIDKDTGIAYGNIRITVRPAPATTQGVS